MTNLRPFSRLALLLGAVVLSTAAVADDRRAIDERRPLKADARVTVRNVAGTIDVETWDRNELHLTGHLADEVEELVIQGDASDLDIEVRIPKKTRNIDHTDLRLRVPAGIRFDGEAVSADIRVRGLKGDVKATSVSGEVTLDVGSRAVRAESVSGDVEVRAPAAAVQVQSVSGDVTVTGARGEITGESVSGDVKVEARDVRELRVNTVSGDVLLDVTLDKGAEVEGETLSGDVTLTLPSAPDGRVELESFSGSVRYAFGEVEGDGKRFRLKGPGSGQVELHSHSGDVHVRKR